VTGDERADGATNRVGDRATNPAGDRATHGAVAARPPVRRSRVVAVVAGALMAVTLAGCRAGGPFTGQGAGDPAGSASTRQPAANASPVSPATIPGGSGATGSAGGRATVPAPDLAGIDRDLSGLSSADDSVHADLDAAASDSAQPDNG